MTIRVVLQTLIQPAMLADVRLPNVLIPNTGDTITFHYGVRYLQQNEQPTRCVWVVTQSAMAPPEKVNGYNPRQILTRKAMVEAHLWAKNYDAAEGLADILWGALYLKCEGVYTEMDEDPDNPENLTRTDINESDPTQPGTDFHSWKYVVRFQVDIPVLLPPQTIQTATTGVLVSPP